MKRIKKGTNTPYGGGVPSRVDDDDANGMLYIFGPLAMLVASLWIFNPPQNATRLNLEQKTQNGIVTDSTRADTTNYQSSFNYIDYNKK